MSQPLDRRAFMHRAAGASAVVSMSLAGPLTRKVLGANDRVRVGVIGTGRQGLSNLKAFKDHGAEIAAVCDVFAPNLEKGRAAASEGAATHTVWPSRRTGNTPTLTPSSSRHWPRARTTIGSYVWPASERMISYASPNVHPG